MTVRVTWAPDMPPEVRAAAEPLLAPHLSRLPGWCADLIVRWGDASKNVAEMAPEQEYRRAVLIIGAAFLTDDPAERARTIAHEFAHVTLEPLYRVASDLVERLPKAERARAREVLRRANEATTCDVGESWGTA